MKLALAAAALTGVQVGAALVASRAVIGELTPGTLALLRYAIGVALLAPLWWHSARRGRGAAALAPMPRHERIAIALLGVLQFGVPIVLLNHALAHIPASLAALLFATFPLMAMLLAIALGHERWRPAVAGGVLLSIGGVGIALGEQAISGGNVAPGALAVGAALSLAAAACGASCAVLYRPYLARHAAARVGVLAMAASVLALLPLALAEGALRQVPLLSQGGWVAVCFVGASSGVGYWLWLWALAHAPATRVTVFLALAPITAAVLGHLLLGEPWSVALLVGSIGVLGGLLVTTRAARGGRHRATQVPSGPS
jgi:drug/metabolite transporter (DMT)-like permease